MGRLAAPSALGGGQTHGWVSVCPSPPHQRHPPTHPPTLLPTLCIGVPPPTQVAHHFAPRQVAVEILKEKVKINHLAPKRHQGHPPLPAAVPSAIRNVPTCVPHPTPGRGRTRSRRTLLEMATLKGWNLLMAAKDVTSTRVWGFLEKPQPRYHNRPRPLRHPWSRRWHPWDPGPVIPYLAESRVPRVQ